MKQRQKKELPKKSTKKLNIEIAEQLGDFTQPYRFRFFYGGRGAGKSWGIARVLALKALENPIRILCAREYQATIKDSVKTLIQRQISEMGLRKEFIFTDTEIRTKKEGSEFIFHGLRVDPEKIKGLEDISICWVEEAETISRESISILTPTIRKDDSEIWFSFNPKRENAAILNFMKSQENEPDVLIRKILWKDNPWFTKSLDRDRRVMLKTDPDLYAHVWEGEPLRRSQALVFNGKIEVRDVKAEYNERFFHGADWGFSTDANTLVRCFIRGNTLYIDREVYGVGVELDDLPQFFDKIETSRTWPIKADCARPETISYMQRQGFNISGAKKWQGSVEEGIVYLQSFDKIIIDTKCINAIREFTGYSYKTDRNGDILPILIDKDNHIIDAVRYALDGYIKSDDVTSLYENMNFYWV